MRWLSKTLGTCVALFVAALAFGDDLPTVNVTVANNSATLWYNQPSAVYHAGTRLRTYFGWTSTTGLTQLRAYDHLYKAWTTPVTLMNWGKSDDHAAPALHVVRNGPKAGTILAAYSFHSSALYLSTSATPESPYVFRQRILSTMPHTYPRFCETADGRIFLFARVRPDPTSFSKGQLGFYESRDGGQTWLGPKVAVDFGVGTIVYAGPVRAFGNQLAVAFSVFDQAANRFYPSVYYIRSDDFGQTWKDGLGRPLGGFAGPSTVPFRTSPLGWQQRIWDLALNERGQPMVAFVEYPEEYGGVFNRKVGQSMVGVLRGTFWSLYNVAKSSLVYYPGGMAFANDGKSVFVSVPNGSVSRLDRFGSTAPGGPWAFSRTIAGTATVSAARPQAVFNAHPDLGITWLDVRSYTHYTTYDATLRCAMVAPMVP